MGEEWSESQECGEGGGTGEHHVGEAEGMEFQEEGAIQFIQHSLVVCQMKTESNFRITNAGEGGKKREASYTVGGNVNWCSHYGEQYGGSSKNQK